ncbi:unnamed protein product [Mycena citricolor]|uniref:Uncharacterized protein n=1 Tax=Mycena citricolor TaxID=2018698 RepID=A0AAD2Q2A4_9AGAR|nr:unnamed protein product [Mycena citricolor]
MSDAGLYFDTATRVGVLVGFVTSCTRARISASDSASSVFLSVVDMKRREID